MKRLIAALALVAGALVVGPAPDAAATFSGDSGDLIFSRWTKGQSDLWSLDPRSGVLTRLSRSKNFNEGMPDWSADGEHVAYSRCAVADPTRCDIWVMNADGTDKRRLTFTGKAKESWPTWSPDGKEIAYTVARNETQSLWVIDVKDGEKRRLTRKTYDSFPEWSPDGKQIVYTSYHQSVENVWVIDEDGDDAEQITFGVKDAKHPDWSPDGKHIVFSRDGDIWTIDDEGDEPARRLVRTPLWAFAPTLSPDGESLAYNVLMPRGAIAIWTKRIDGESPARMTWGARDFFVDWQAE